MTTPSCRRRRASRQQRGQAMLEYSALTYMMVVGAVGLGWPFLVLLLNAINTYFQSIYWMLGQPL